MWASINLSASVRAGLTVLLFPIFFFKGERRSSFQREKQLRFSASPEKKDGRGSSDGGMSDEEEVKQNVWGKKKSDQNAIFRGKGREKMADFSVVPKKMEISKGMGGGG